MKKIHHSRGFTIVELILVLSIISILSIYAVAELARKTEEDIAISAGLHLKQVSDAAAKYMLINFDALSHNRPVPGVADPTGLNPTLQELRDLGRLNSGFPIANNSMPTQQTVQVSIRMNPDVGVVCPGSKCSFEAFACTTTPVTLGGSFTRFDLAQAMVDAQGGTGMMTRQGEDVAFIRGAGKKSVNPSTQAEGIVCGSNVMDTGLYDRFVNFHDTRNPDLQGDLTLRGDFKVSSDVLDPTKTCAQILALTGKAGFGCGVNPEDIPLSYRAGGAVKTPNVVTTENVLVASNATAGDGTTGGYARMSVNAGIGEIKTSGRSQGDILVPSGARAENSACLVTDEGAIVKNSTGSGVLYCRGLFWRRMISEASSGNFCSVNGSRAVNSLGVEMMCVNNAYKLITDIVRFEQQGAACNASQEGFSAIDLATSSGLICKAGKYRLLADLIGQGIANIAIYTNGQSIVHPGCYSGTTPQFVVMGVTSACVMNGGAAVGGCANNSGAYAGSLITNGAGATVQILGADGSWAGNDASMTVAAICAF